MTMTHIALRRLGRLLTLALISSLISPFVAPAAAQTMISLQSQPADLSAVNVGDTFNVDVTLAGLSPGDAASLAAATVEFDAQLFSMSPVVVGSIVPDATGFLALPNPGTADGVYDSLLAASGSSITANGTLFSFELTALQTGDTEIGISFADLLGVSAAPVATSNPLPVSIVVPEPAGMSLVALGVLVLATLRRRR